jgi:hypothetical protein
MSYPSLSFVNEGEESQLSFYTKKEKTNETQIFASSA